METRKTPLYMYENTTPKQDTYLAENGYHFSEAACNYAVSKMRKRKEGSDDTEPIKPMTRKEVDGLLDKYDIQLEKCEGWDHVYVANQCLADLKGSSISDEMHMALYIQNVIDDVDAGEGEVFYSWMDKMRSRGMRIDWELLL